MPDMSPWSSCLWRGLGLVQYQDDDPIRASRLTADANAHSAAQDDGEKDRGRRTGEDLVRKSQC